MNIITARSTRSKSQEQNYSFSSQSFILHPCVPVLCGKIYLKIWYILRGTVVTEAFEVPSRVFWSMKLEIWNERGRKPSLCSEGEWLRNSSPEIILQLPCYYKEKAIQQSPGCWSAFRALITEAGRLMQGEHFSQTALCPEQSSAIFRAVVKSRGTFVETPKGHRVGRRWRGRGIFSLAAWIMP